MWHPSTLRYRVLVPLAMMTVALVSGISVALTTFFLVDRHVESNAEAETRRLAGTMARALVQPVLRNDTWQAFQLVRAATLGVAQGMADTDVHIVVLDAQQRVFVSPTPRAYPIGLHVSHLPPAMLQASTRVSIQPEPEPGRAYQKDPPLLVLSAPIMGEEGEQLGTVLVTHPLGISRSQRAVVIQQLTALGLLAMALVALAGAALGWRLTVPLGRLRKVIQNTPRQASMRAQLEAPELARLCQRPDEVGDLARSYSAMLRQVVANQELERHMLEAERLASVGQLSASIAHEVNNPLGGMLAAVQNRRLLGPMDEATQRTISLLERGLRHIHETVQALLKEARSEQRLLQADDLHDLALLLRPEADHLMCKLHWQIDAPAHAHLPAVAVRQVLLNLTLNAMAAAGRKGTVKAWSSEAEGHWNVMVGNTGPTLDPQRLTELTHEAHRSSDGRLGLGLWITARILHTLGGELRLQAPVAGLDTVLAARFPLTRDHEPTPSSHTHADRPD